jgi:hypothetical protein
MTGSESPHPFSVNSPGKLKSILGGTPKTRYRWELTLQHPLKITDFSLLSGMHGDLGIADLLGVSGMRQRLGKLGAVQE